MHAESETGIKLTDSGKNNKTVFAFASRRGGRPIYWHRKKEKKMPIINPGQHFFPLSSPPFPPQTGLTFLRGKGCIAHHVLSQGRPMRNGRDRNNNNEEGGGGTTQLKKSAKELIFIL